jgi:hypothetical protein
MVRAAMIHKQIGHQWRRSSWVGRAILSVRLIEVYSLRLRTT